MDKKKLLDIAYNHQNKYIKLADQKASILVSGQIAFVALILNLLNNINSELNSTTGFLITICIISSISSIVFSILTIIPRKESDESDGYVFWEDITDYGNKEIYSDALNSIDENSIINEVSKEVYNLSKITNKKYRFLKISVLLSILFIIFGSLSVVSYLCYN